jgi:O-antigen/teichoic acid export membrane protein
VLAAIPDAAVDAIQYAGALPPDPHSFGTPAQRYYINGLLISAASSGIAAVLLCYYIWWLPSIHSTPLDVSRAQYFAATFGLGIILRLFSESAGGTLQATGHIATDNVLQMICELIWGIATWVLIMRSAAHFEAAGEMYCLSGFVLLFARGILAAFLVQNDPVRRNWINWAIIRQLVAYGLLVTAAQSADFLYAPTDNLLISGLLGTSLVATYVPAIQVDSALLLSVTALSAVLLPRAAIEHGRGNIASVRRYYFRGTFACTAILLLGAVAAWALSPLAFRLWLHDPMPATQSILPLILIHTVIGGSSAVGRSILLAIGKVKPFTVAVLLAGVTNVALSYIFVRYFRLGLPGIIYGTIIAVTGRCGIWMPWYILRVLRAGDVHPDKGVDVPIAPEVI